MSVCQYEINNNNNGFHGLFLSFHGDVHGRRHSFCKMFWPKSHSVLVQIASCFGPNRIPFWPKSHSKNTLL